MDLDSLSPGFLEKHPGGFDAALLDEVERVTGRVLPRTLRALFVGDYVSIGGLNGLNLFDADLLRQYNLPPPPKPAVLAAPPVTPAERLLGGIFDDDRLPGSNGMLFFCSDGGGILAFADLGNRLSRGGGAIFMAYPGDGDVLEHGRFLASSFAEFLGSAHVAWKANGSVDLYALAEAQGSTRGITRSP